MKYTLYCLFAVCFAVFYSCSSKDKQLTALERIQIFQEKYATTPDVSFQTTDHVLIYYLEAKTREETDLSKFLFLKADNSRWEEINKVELVEDVTPKADSIQIMTLDDIPYLYYEQFLHGGSLGNYSISFVLYDYRKGEFFSMHYEYVPGGDIAESEFTPSNNLQTNLVIKSFLEEKAYKSSRVYQRDELENIKWNFFNENRESLQKLNSTYGEWFSFAPIETDKKLFELRKPETDVVAENDHYIVAAYFKSSVYAYDKRTKKYRIVWILESQYDWIQSLNFDLNGFLVMFVNPSVAYGVDLQHSDYVRFIPKATEPVVEEDTSIDGLSGEDSITVLQ